jgi:histidine triad (HIT) family protein
MAETSCLFCKIRDGQIPAKKLFEDDDCFAFRDINPQAPTHVLVCPKRHIASLDALTQNDALLVGKLVAAAARIAREEGLAEAGYRTVVNTGRAAGQTVFHLHVHVLGGRDFAWPPG